MNNNERRPFLPKFTKKQNDQVVSQTFLDPTNDVTFRKVFGDEKHTEVLISLLNSLLNLTDERRILTITILNPFQAPHLEGTKYTILDVRCKDQRGVEFIVEMQVAKHEAFDKRLLYYASRAYSRQLTQGDDYPRLNQVILLVFTAFKIDESADYLSRHLILNEKTGSHLLRDFEFFFVELPKFTKTEEELESLSDKWIYFFKNASKFDDTPAPLHIDEIEIALNSLRQMRWTEKELILYEDFNIARQMEKGRVETGIKEGIEAAVKAAVEVAVKEAVEVAVKAAVEDAVNETKKAARKEADEQVEQALRESEAKAEQALKESEAKAEKEKKDAVIEIARNLKRAGLPIETIAQTTGL